MGKSSGAKNDVKKKSNKKKGSKKLVPDAVAMKQKAPQANPFETIWSRRKFDILGKKRKGEERRVGLSRSLAVEKRKKTLLREYQQSNKSSVFVDKRIGERNDELEEFDKAIMRSQREHQLKLGKKSKYNLSDGEEDEFEEDPRVSFLSDRDDFEDNVPSDDEDEGAGNEKSSSIFKEIGTNSSPGVPGEKEETRRKSKKEVMSEIIQKSKYFKAVKAKDKEEREDLMEELDKNFASLVNSQVLTSLTEPGKMNALKALVNKDIPTQQVKGNALPPTQKPESNKQEQPDSYDKLVNEMVLDMRARPSDRTKTPEQIAQEERERLERLEEERKKRMLEADESSDEDGENIDNVSDRNLKVISGDDLGDSFQLDEDQGTKRGWVDEVMARKNEDDSESEDDEDASEDSTSAENDGDDDESEDLEEHEKPLYLKDWEQSDDENVGTDMDEDEQEEIENDEDMDSRGREKSKIVELGKRNLQPAKVKETKATSKQSSIESDIPFIIEAPTSFEEFSALLLNRSNADVLVVVNRIRASNAIKLAAENRKKMQVFYGVLLQYFAVLANKRPLNFELLNLLVKPLMEMSVLIPYFAAICARQRILHIRTQFCESMKNGDTECWPSLKTLFLLRLWSMIFPCSDFRHVVMTPAILLICEYLMRCPVLSGRDVAIGSFLCSMVLVATKQSRKFCPEAIIFLQTLLMAAKEQKPVLHQDSMMHLLMEFKALRPLLHIQSDLSEISPLDFLMVMNSEEDSSYFDSDDFRASVLLTVIETLRGFVEINEGLSSFPEIFLPISTLLTEVSQLGNLPVVLKGKFMNVSKQINKKVDEVHALWRPLQMRKKKPVPIKLLTPKFEENFVKGRDYDPDRERAEMRKLKKQIKDEAKGAVRELRKDNAYLYDVKQREKKQIEEERAEKYGKDLAFLQEQEHAFKSGQLGKGRKRRR